jgi:hypothetical protein
LIQVNAREVRNGRARTKSEDRVVFDFTGLFLHSLVMRGLVSMSSVVLAFGITMARADGVAPDFKLVDANPNSVRYNSLVSPRDYLLQVSGYYFGSAG